MSDFRAEWTEAVKKLKTPQKPRSKYGAVKITVDGIVFDSKREAARYHELKMMEKAGEIRNLRLQPIFRLMIYPVGRPSVELGSYIGDFQYEQRDAKRQPDEWQRVVEDSKGFKTPLYRWKKKHVEAQYGIQIREV